MPPKNRKTDKVTAEGDDAIEHPPAWLMPCLDRLESSIISGFKSEMAAVESRIGKRITLIDSRIQATETKVTLLVDQNEQVRSDVCELTSKFQALKDELLTKDDKIEALEATLDDLKNRQMRKTLVFRGFPEGVEGIDSWENCKNLITDFVETHLDFPDAEVERAHRAKKSFTPNGGAAKSDNRSRPIFVEFLRWSDSSEILDAAPKILNDYPCKVNGKAVQIFIDQMASKKIQQQRSDVLLVRKYLKSVNKGWKMFIRYPALLFYKSQDMTQYKNLQITDAIQAASLVFKRDLDKGKRRE